MISETHQEVGITAKVVDKLDPWNGNRPYDFATVTRTGSLKHFGLKKQLGPPFVTEEIDGLLLIPKPRPKPKPSIQFSPRTGPTAKLILRFRM